MLTAAKVRRKLFPAEQRPFSAIAVEPAHSDVRGMVVVITGSSRGIGLALAKGFASAGARVVINARSHGELAKARHDLATAGCEVTAVVADISSEDGAEGLLRQAESHFGPVDVLINNAAVAGPPDREVWSIESAQWLEVVRVNILGAAHCSGAFARRAVATGRPVRILNVSSGVVGHGFPKLGAYAVSKDALEGLTRAYGWDSNDQLITVASIQPRSVRTAMTRAHFDAVQLALLDDPESLVPMFLWAATAPAEIVHGRTFNEPAFAADRAGAVHLRGPLAASLPIVIEPETFRPGSDSGKQPGAYMHLLENAHEYCPGVAEDLAAAVRERGLYSYPDPAYRSLRQAISREAGASPEQIALGAGSSDLIDRILRLFCAPGDSVVVTKPTWSFFQAFVRRWHLLPNEVPITGSLRAGSLRHDLEGMLMAITARTRLVYLVNPCNPTGTFVAPDELESFVVRIPSHVVTVIDEAYIQYMEPELRPALMSSLAKARTRLIILRTFSKFFGLSGLRVGYACTTAETAQMLDRAQTPFCISSPACMAVLAALKDQAFRQRVYETNASGRRRLAEGLGALEIASQPSQTNFVLFECPTDPHRLREDLRTQGLILPDVNQFLRNYALLAVGKSEHNELVLQALSRY